MTSHTPPPPPGMEPPPVPAAEHREPPESVRTAYILWLIACVAVFASYATNLLPGAYNVSPAQLRDAIGPAAEQFTDAQLNSLATVSRAVLVGGVAVVVVLLVLVVRAMRKGARWARMVLQILGRVIALIGILAVLSLLLGMAASSGVDPLIEFIALGANIVAGLCTGVAVWQLNTREARDFYEDRKSVV